MWHGVCVAVSERRIGATDSASRTQLLDAAEKLLMTEGYASVTSRRVAAEAGLKPQLVHYYFRTMDDLFVALLQRSAELNLAHFDKEIAKDGSLANLWRLNSDPRGSAFMIEFAALSNHRKEIRSELAAYAERFRKRQLEAVRVALENEGVDVPAEAVLLLATGLSQIMGIEKNLGMTTGHKATQAFVRELIERLAD